MQTCKTIMPLHLQLSPDLHPLPINTETPIEPSQEISKELADWLNNCPVEAIIKNHPGIQETFRLSKVEPEKDSFQRQSYSRIQIRLDVSFPQLGDFRHPVPECSCKDKPTRSGEFLNANPEMQYCSLCGGIFNAYEL